MLPPPPSPPPRLICRLSPLQTFLVGKVDERGVELVETAYQCLAAAVDMVQPGGMYRDLGARIGKIARERGQQEVGEVWAAFVSALVRSVRPFVVNLLLLLLSVGSSATEQNC